MRSSRSGTPISASARAISARVAPARLGGAAVWGGGGRGHGAGFYHIGRGGKKADGPGQVGSGALLSRGFAATVSGDG